MTVLSEFENVLLSKKRNERKLHRRSLLFVFLIVTFSLAWLYFTSKKIESQKKENKKLFDQKVELEKQITSLRLSLDSVSRLSKYTVEIGFADIKPLWSNYGEIAKQLSTLLYLKEKNPQFNYNATADIQYIKNNEFSSPSLIIYILKGRYIDEKIKNRQELEQFFSQNSRFVTRDNPEFLGDRKLQTGDIIFYETGYVMLYINLDISEHGYIYNKEYCIGMTPLGILTLKPNFAKIIKIARPRRY